MKEQEALVEIERIAGDDFCNELEWFTRNKTEYTVLSVAAQKLSRIYQIAHSHVKSHPCYAIHKEWRKLRYKQPVPSSSVAQKKTC